MDRWRKSVDNQEKMLWNLSLKNVGRLIYLKNKTENLVKNSADSVRRRNILKMKKTRLDLPEKIKNGK